LVKQMSPGIHIRYSKKMRSVCFSLTSQSNETGALVRIRWTIIFCCLLLLVGASLQVSAQATAAGTRDSNGRILTKVVVTMNEPGAFGRPASGLAFLFVSEDGDRVSVRTNEAGVASIWLNPGDYRLVTPDPLEWEGYAYTWDRMISVAPRAAVIQLSQDEARSIARAVATKSNTVRTSEPAGLSSTPTLWKAASTTQDLRKTETTRAPLEEPRQVRVLESAPATRSVEPSRKGFWFNLGSGYGAITCATCYDAVGGFSGGLSLGGTIGSKLRVGLGTTSWYKSENGFSLITGTIDARLRFYPSTSNGFFITGGVGAGTIGADLAGYGSGSEFGVGSVAGLGWDMPIASSVSLTPYWNFFNVTTSHTKTTVGQVGIGFTFHQ
jgi:hypothetical protein